MGAGRAWPLERPVVGLKPDSSLGITAIYLRWDPMSGNKQGTVRWIDSETEEDFTDRMNDPSAPPGDGILRVVRALARQLAAQQFEAERQLLKAVSAELEVQTAESSILATPQVGDEVTLNGVSYKYDGSTEDGEHFTRLKGQDGGEALVSLRRGSAAADWMLTHLTRPQFGKG